MNPDDDPLEVDGAADGAADGATDAGDDGDDGDDGALVPASVTGDVDQATSDESTPETTETNSLYRIAAKLTITGCALALVGVFLRWTSGDGITLNGIQGPHNGWVILLYLILGISVLRSIRRGGRTAALAVLLVSVVTIVVVVGTHSVPGLGRAWGYWLTLVAGLVLAAASATAFAGRRAVALALEPSEQGQGIRWRFPTLGEVGLVLALLFFPFLGRVIMIGETPSWPPPTDSVSAADAQTATELFAASGDGPDDVDIDYAWSTADTIEPWAEGTEFYPRIFDDIRNAESSVHILMFGWKPGEIGDALTDLLVEKAADGVAIRAVVDGVGSLPTSSSRAMYDRLVEAGVDVVINDPVPLDRDRQLPDRVFDWRQDEVGRADHRKLFVIDGHTAWTGGAGIEDHFANGEFYDVMVRVTGDVVLQAQSVFLNAFASHGGPMPAVLDVYFPDQVAAGGTPAAIVQVVPGGFVSATQSARELIDDAEIRLDIMNPYVTDRDMIERIIQAAERGVAVRIITSEKSNNVLAAKAMQYRYGDMIDSGIEIWELPGSVVHAKLIVADDHVQFGTLNLDAWALYRNFEIAIVADSHDTAEKLEERVFEPSIERSNLATAPATGDQIVNWLVEKIAYFL